MSTTAPASGTCPVATLDDLVALQPDVVRCPYGAYEQARNSEPGVFNDRLGAWIVTRHDDVLAVLRDADRFSNRLASGPSSVSGLAEKVLKDDSLPERTRKAAARRIELSKSRVLLFSDPPLHKRQRSLVNTGFTPRRVAQLHDSIESLANDLIDEFPSDGEAFDIVGAFSTPIPMTVIATLLGVPPKLMGTFKGWSNAFTRGVGALDHDADAIIEIFDQVNEFYDYFTEELAKRRENPVDDLLSDLLAARLDGKTRSQWTNCSRCSCSSWWPATRPRPTCSAQQYGDSPPTRRCSSCCARILMRYQNSLKRCCDSNRPFRASGASPSKTSASVG